MNTVTIVIVVALVVLFVCIAVIFFELWKQNKERKQEQADLLFKMESIFTLVKIQGQSLEEVEQKLTPEKVREVNDPNLISYPSKGLSVRTERYPNKDMITLHLSLPLFTDPARSLLCGYKFNYPNSSSCDTDSIVTPSEELQKYCADLFETKKFKSVLLNAFEVSLEKSPAMRWEDILGQAREIIVSWFPDVDKEEEVVPGEVAEEHT